MLKILYLKTLIIVRKQFEVTAEKISNILEIKVSSALLYVVAFFLSLGNGLMIALFVLQIVSKATVKFLLISIGGFCLLNSLVKGKYTAKYLSELEEDTVLLCSDLSDLKIFFVKIAEGLIMFLLANFYLFIPVFPVISFLSVNLIDFLGKSAIFVGLNLLVFMISTSLTIKQLKGETLTRDNLFSEGLAFFRYIGTIYLSYFFARVIIGPILQNRIKIEHFVSVPTKAAIEFSNNIKGALLPLLQPFLKIYYGVKASSGSGYFGVLEIILGIIVVLLGFALLFGLSPVKYRYAREHAGLEWDFKKRIVRWYVSMLSKAAASFFKKNVYLKKDLIVFREKYNLIFSRMGLAHIFLPFSTVVVFGILLFMFSRRDNSLTTLLLLYYVVFSMYDLTSVLKYLLNIVVSPGSEMRNISLVKMSGYGLVNLLRDKINLLRLFMGLPAAIAVLQVLLAMVITGWVSLWRVFLVIAVAVSSFILAPILQLYGDIFYDKYNYKNYEELHGNALEMVMIYNNFFQIPRRLMVFPLFMGFILGCFFDFNARDLEKVAFWSIGYYFGLSSLLYGMTKLVIWIGGRAFGKKIVTME